MEHENAVAELFSTDDTLRFRVQAQKTIPQEDVRIAVEVSALVSTTRPADEALEARIRAALGRFIVADWSFSAVQRDGDAVGFERVSLQASARAPVTQVYNLEERARQASEEGLSLKEPRVNYALSTQRVDAIVQQLRLELLEDVKRQMQQFNEATGRDWRIGDILFGVVDPMAEVPTSKRAFRSQTVNFDIIDRDGSDEMGLANAERISLVAEVTLKSPKN